MHKKTRKGPCTRDWIGSRPYLNEMNNFECRAAMMAKCFLLFAQINDTRLWSFLVNSGCQNSPFDKIRSLGLNKTSHLNLRDIRETSEGEYYAAASTFVQQTAYALSLLVTSVLKPAYRFPLLRGPRGVRRSSPEHGIVGVIFLQRPWVRNPSSLMHRPTLVNRLAKHDGERTWKAFLNWGSNPSFCLIIGLNGTKARRVVRSADRQLEPDVSSLIFLVRSIHQLRSVDLCRVCG